MPHVHQCPQCELAFANEADVRDHLVSDHGADPETFEHRPRGWSRRAPDDRTAPDLVHPSRPQADDGSTNDDARGNARASGS